MSGNGCSKIGFGLDNFSIIRKRESDYHTKIHDALLIKKHTPSHTNNFMMEVHLSCFCCFNSTLYQLLLKHLFVLQFIMFIGCFVQLQSRLIDYSL